MKIAFDLNKSTILLMVMAVGVGYLIGNVFQIPVSESNKATVNQPTTGNTQQPSTVKLDVPSYVPSLGSDSAKVNFIEFGDYQCPFCERFFQQTEPQLIQDYVNSGKVKFYFMDFQFLGPDSQTLGQGAWCANEQGKYYEYHDYVYSNQGQENSGWATPDKVKTMAASISGLDVQKFGSCLDSKKYVSRVQELTSLGQTSGVSGTPSTFIGNSKDGYVTISGAQPYSVFKQAIDSLL